MRRVSVNEVLRRAEQGRTQPFLCRCDDGASYYVKGKSAGPRGLAAELVCAQLAAAIGLPVPEAVIVDVPEDLVAEARYGGLSLDALGTGPGFGSKVVQAVEFTLSHRQLLHDEVAQSLVVFDWWIRNEDRTLTARGGNVNLLWRIQETPGLVVIDHNLAFSDFDAVMFLQTHVFADAFQRVATDISLRTAWSNRLAAALETWDDVVATLPMEWNYIDIEQTIPSKVDLAVLKAVLDQCAKEHFWKLP